MIESRALVCLAVALVPSLAGAQVAGVVTDAASGSPIAGALVTLQTTDQRATTAVDGSYSLPGVIGASLTLVAAKKGYYYASTLVSTPANANFQMEVVAAGNDPNYAFVAPATCGSCHPDQLAQWTGSPMAKAGTNTWVYDIYDGSGSPGGMGGFVYTRDSVVAPIYPESECAACHQPEPWVENPNTALEPLGALSQGALHGVSCDICHKIADIDASRSNFPGIWPGIVTLNRPASSVHQVQYGALGDVSFDLSTVMRGSYQPQLLAEACAACHQDKNDPDHDGDFEEANGVISEPTYLEWLASPYGDETSDMFATCVECHMPAFGSQFACVAVQLQRDQSSVRSHAILGTTPAYLENAVDLSMSATVAGNQLQVAVDVTNDQTGHHVPTGVTVRNMILLVEAWSVADGQRLALVDGSTVHALGGVGSPAQGYYAGLPGKLFAKVNHDASGNGPTFFTDATGIQFDSRIPALATDSTNYTFTVPTGTGAVRVRARLIYRRAFRAFVDAKQWTTDGHGNPLEDIQPPYFGHLMEEAEWTSAGTGDVETFGNGCGGLQIAADGTPFSGNADFALTLSGAAPNVPALLLLGFDDTAWGALPLPYDLAPMGGPGCFVLTSTESVQGGSFADAAGGARFPMPLPVAGAAGIRFYAQWLARTTATPLGWYASDALSVIIQR